jgi:hypothetical protein
MSITGKIYKNQTGLRYRLRTYQPVSSMNAAYIKFRKPPDADYNYVTGSWPAVIDSGATASMGVVYVEFSGRPTALDEAGTWKFWSYVKFVGGGTAPGEAVEEVVFAEGEGE